jgi:hypothetical protein
LGLGFDVISVKQMTTTRHSPLSSQLPSDVPYIYSISPCPGRLSPHTLRCIGRKQKGRRYQNLLRTLNFLKIYVPSASCSQWASFSTKLF